MHIKKLPRGSFYFANLGNLQFYRSYFCAIGLKISQK